MDGEITPADVEDLLTSETPPRIVDIRSAMEFEREHIPGSENVPFAELPQRVDEFVGADRIVTVCPHGQASVQAARLIGSYEGITDARVESMEGGITSWAGPLESTEPDPDEGPDAPF